jgi:hypothetical protein
LRPPNETTRPVSTRIRETVNAIIYTAIAVVVINIVIIIIIITSFFFFVVFFFFFFFFQPRQKCQFTFTANFPSSSWSKTKLQQVTDDDCTC